MEASASYDILTETYSHNRSPCAHTNEVAYLDCGEYLGEDQRLDTVRKPTRIKKLKSLLWPTNHPRSNWYIINEDAPSPETAYWNLSGEQFTKSLDLEPVTSHKDNESFLGEGSDKSEKSCDAETLVLEDVMDLEETLQDGNRTTRTADSLNVNLKRMRYVLVKHLKSWINTKSGDVDLKIIVAGDDSVGKSSIIRRFIHGTFESEQGVRPTGYETKLMTFRNNKEFCVHVFEVSGDISTAIMSPTCVSGAIGAMIVFDINDEQSFASIRRYKKNLDARYKQTKHGRVPCLLLANKCDADDLSFDMCELDDYCSKQGIHAWFDTSAKNDFNIKNAFVFLIQHILAGQRGNKSLNCLDAEKKARDVHSPKLSFRRSGNVLDEESTTML